MDQADTSSKEYRYAGFISYSQKDKRWARRIHRALENYRLPTGIAQETAGGKRLGRFFRDDDELAGEPSLGTALESALDSAAALVVVCSPNSARSKWVDAEIAQFKSRGPSARVFAIIVDGQPDHPDPEVMCFSPSMLRKVDADGVPTDEADEPLAPDVRKEPFNRLIARLVAGLLGVQFDTLWQREQRRIRRRRLLTAAAVSIASVATAIGITLYLDAEHEAELARLEQLRAESHNLATAAQTAMDEGRVEDALLDALAALPEDLAAPERPLTDTAIAALKRVMTANHAAGIVTRFDQPVDRLRVLADGHLAVRLGNGQVRVIAADSGAPLWQSPDGERLDWLAGKDLAARTWTDESLNDKGELQIQHTVVVRDLTNGQIQKQLASDAADWYLGPLAPISPDGSRVMVQRTVTVPVEDRHHIAVWRVPDQGQSTEPEVLEQIAGPVLENHLSLTGTFVDENTLMLSWGDARRELALWHLGSGGFQKISSANSALACEGQVLDPAPKRRDYISLSADRTLIAHAIPALDAGWCVSLWRAEDGSALPAMLIDESHIGGVEALSTDKLMTSRNYYSSARLWSRNGEEQALRGCEAQRVDLLNQYVVDQTRWLINSDRDFMACISDDLIHTYLGRAFADQRTLRGHRGKVNALAFDPAHQRLYSAGDDGTLRAWTFGAALRSFPISNQVINMASADDRIGVSFRDAQGHYHAQVYNPEGQPISPLLPYNLNLPAGGLPQGQRLNLELLFLSGGQSLALLESWECGFMACPPERQNRLTLYRVDEGTRLAQVGNLRPGKFLADSPVAHALSGNADRLALIQRDGNAIELDSKTGRTLRRFRDKEWPVTDVAYTAETLWLLTDDKAEEPADRNMQLMRIDTDGSATVAAEQRAQTGRLHGSPSGGAALVEYSLAHLSTLSSRYQLLTSDTLPRALQLPAEQRDLESVLFYAGDQRLAMLFGKDGSAPLHVDIQSARVSNIQASIPSGTLDPWRIDDPLQRMVASTDGDTLYLLELPGKKAVCKELAGQNADAARFSPDGALLAIADYGEAKLEVYDLQSCSRIYSAPVTVRHNGLMRFADADSLWTITDRGQIRIINLATDLDSIHERAKHLRSALGLSAAAARP